MNLQNVYNTIKKSLNADWMSELKSEKLTVNTTTDFDIDQAWSILKDFQPTQGWVQTLDKVQLIEKGQMLEIDDHLICAELVNADNESLHIRPASKGKLNLVRFTSGQGESYYVTQTSHQIKHGKQTGQATYGLYWQTNSQSTQAKFSRLLAIDIKEGK